MKNFKLLFITIVAVTVTLVNAKALAITTVQFFLSGQAMVNIASSSPNGQSDQDPVELYKIMNVEPKNSIMGPGKAIVTGNKDLNFTCGNPPGRGATCSLVLQNSSRVSMNPFAKTVTFHAVGKDAMALSKLFVTNGGKLEFLSTDQMFRLEVSDQEVSIQASGN